MFRERLYAFAWCTTSGGFFLDWVLLFVPAAKHMSSQFGTDSKNVIFLCGAQALLGISTVTWKFLLVFSWVPRVAPGKNMSPSASSKCCHWKIHLGPLRPPFFPRFFVMKCLKDVLEKKCCKRVFVETCCRQVLEKSVIDQSWSGAL